MTTKPKLVYLEWADAISNPNWRTRIEADEWAKTSNWIIHSIGWVIEETDKYIVLALGYSPEDKYSAEMFVNLHKIPKTWIRKRKLIKL